MNYIKITSADYLPITERKVWRIPALGVLLLLTFVLGRGTLLSPTVQAEQAEAVVVPNETTAR